NLERADVERRHAPREATTTTNRHGIAECVDADASREEQVDGLRRAGGEQAGILEKEGTLLRKEEREAREVRALLVYFYLRKVGVVGEVERQAGRDAV